MSIPAGGSHDRDAGRGHRRRWAKVQVDLRRAAIPDARARAILRGKETAVRDLSEAGGGYDLNQVRQVLDGISPRMVDRKVRAGQLLAVPGPSGRRKATKGDKRRRNPTKSYISPGDGKRAASGSRACGLCQRLKPDKSARNATVSAPCRTAAPRGSGGRGGRRYPIRFCRFSSSLSRNCWVVSQDCSGPIRMARSLVMKPLSTVSMHTASRSSANLTTSGVSSNWPR